MKRCQKCNRSFPDENQKFCTFDGGLLRTDQPAFDPNVTMRATSSDVQPPTQPPVRPPVMPSDSSEAQTSVRLRDMNETIAVGAFSESASSQDASTAPTGGITSSDLTAPPYSPSTSSQTSSDLINPYEPATGAPTSADLTMPHVRPTSAELPPPPPRPPVVETTALPSSPQPGSPPPLQQAPPPLVRQSGPPRKKSKVPLILGILVVLFLLGSGALVAGYFFLLPRLKPLLETNRRPPINRREPANENTNSTASTSTNSASSNANTSANANVAPKPQPEPFVPPSDAVQFSNSKANLDGELADHYVGFSFYYPKIWTKDPKAGVRGASSFAKIDHQFKDDTGEYIGERVTFNWYPSNGSYEADLSVFPDSAQKLTKGLPNYEEVSRGQTTVNVYKGYQVLFKGVLKNTGKGDLPYFGRVIFLPPATPSEKSGVAIVMLATSLAPGMSSAEDVGAKGELAMMLESFRFAPHP